MSQPKKAEVDFSKQMKKRSKKKASQEAKKDIDQEIENIKQGEQCLPKLEPIFFEFIGERYELVRIDQNTAFTLDLLHETMTGTLTDLKDILDMILVDPLRDSPRFERALKTELKAQLQKIRNWDGEGDKPVNQDRHLQNIFKGLENAMMKLIPDPKDSSSASSASGTGD